MKRHDGEADGGSAFPSHGSMGEVEHRGMSLRDWFAGQALMGASANANTAIGPSGFTLLANIAFQIGEAMIAERERRKGGTNEKN